MDAMMESSFGMGSFDFSTNYKQVWKVPSQIWTPFTILPVLSILNMRVYSVLWLVETEKGPIPGLNCFPLVPQETILNQSVTNHTQKMGKYSPLHYATADCTGCDCQQGLIICPAHCSLFSRELHPSWVLRGGMRNSVGLVVPIVVFSGPPP